jgi:quinol---cytochrome-c reductase cytochrome c subunit
MNADPKGPVSRGRARLVQGLLVLVVCAVAAGITALSGSAAPMRSATATATASVSPTPSPSGSSAGDTMTLGRRVFLRDCAWCHGSSGGGTENGPTLRSAGEAMADFQLRTGRMPLDSPDDQPESGPPAYSSDTIDALVRYVGSLGTGEPLPTVVPGDVGHGQSLFTSNCAPCHSSSGTGMILPDGTWAPQLYGTGSRQIAEAIRLGPGQMPKFGSKQLDETDVDDLVSYVQTLGPTQVKGGNGLDQFGPIAEGIFLFFVPLPLLLLVIRLLGKKAP